MYKNTLSSDELYHFGIRGMKWGVRKYQNEDGSLTSKGEKRYRTADTKTKEEISKMTGHEKRVAYRKELKGLTRYNNDNVGMSTKLLLNNRRDAYGNNHYANVTKQVAKSQAHHELMQKYGKKTTNQIKAENAALITAGTVALNAAIIALAYTKSKK